MGGPMIKVLRSKVGDELIRRRSESQKTRDVLERVNEQLGISETPAVAAELSDQPETSSRGSVADTPRLPRGTK
jgi:hypothetical protein